ncbi:MAG: hypothetical protein FWG37_02925 [Clostridia bacterium]|nr:hypothetical protein [Clostridia bacterium]
MAKINVTRHAAYRGQERAGIKKTSMLNRAQIAFENGVGIGDASPALRAHVQSLMEKGSLKAKNIRIHGEHVFLFDENKTLITVLPLPQRYASDYKRSKLRMESGRRGAARENLQPATEKSAPGSDEEWLALFEIGTDPDTWP